MIDYLSFSRFERVTQISRAIIGTKQAVKAICIGRTSEISIAIDANNWVTNPAILFAKEIGVPITHVNSKKELGKYCSIQVEVTIIAITVR